MNNYCTMGFAHQMDVFSYVNFETILKKMFIIVKYESRKTRAGYIELPYVPKSQIEQMF